MSRTVFNRKENKSAIKMQKQRKQQRDSKRNFSF
jgi:hypothetical protein